MSDSSQRQTNGPTGPKRTLAERVKARVAEAGRDLDERAGNGTPERGERKPRRNSRREPALTQQSEEQREARSMRRVYREMANTYRAYRKENNRPAVPELREAVHAFKQGQSLTSLVNIASFLDDRQLLGW